MTDIEIVRTLAEFEGIWPEDAASEPFERGDSWCVAVPFSKGTVCQYLRKYITLEMVGDKLIPVDPARVTVAPEPEAYKADCWKVRGQNSFLAEANGYDNAAHFAAELNRLHKLAAAKGGA